MATSFLDASTIYGNNDIQLQSLRDFNNNGKMKLEYFQTPDGQFGYPPQNADGELITGIVAKTKNVFTDMFATLFLREHNRLCDDLYEIHGNDWDDEKYFQEARRWVIAFIQRITYYEYLGTALGANLPPYKAYDPNLRPTIDTFFASVTFRYGHSEISLDLVRGRDHGIPSYNDAREAFNLPRKSSWAEISSDIEVQKKLQETYGTVDRVEALMGGLAEDHVNGGNYGELFSKSFSESWLKIRDSDRFWYENKDAGFTKDEISKIQQTTLLQILERNTPQYVTYPQNLWVQIFLGLIKYGADKAFIWAYLAWLTSEFYYKIKNMQFLWPARQADDLSERIRACIPHKFYEHLPAISWSEFNQRVMTGASLVIAEGLVFDIHKWIPIHPGGQKILQRVIGTDITNDFFFDPSVVTVINQNFSNEYDDKQQNNSISVLTDNNYRDKRQHETMHKPHSIANAVDMINSSAFKHCRVAMHRHSKFATSKLASMVIARILDPEEGMMNVKGPPSLSSKIALSKSELAELQPHQHSPNIFRRYILTNIETASRYDAERPVKKFTFQVIHPKDRLPRFLPGDYIEIMSYANNHVAIRPYTPLQGPTDNSFCILVKLYKDGVMSQHLVRGPFDIADRMSHATLPPSIKPTGSIISRPSSPSATSPNRAGNDARMIGGRDGRDNRSFNQQPSMYDMSRGNSIYNSGIGNSNNIGGNNNYLNNILDGRSGILLNKEREDLCWEHLFMVCGGTGITPMLQLIQYHLDKASAFNSDFNLYLLNANDTIADLIQPKYLDYLCQILKGKLKITYILSKPPPIWRGLTGMIDETLLYDWISQNYSVPPPAIPPRLSVASGSGSVLSASTLISNSYQHLHSTSGANNLGNNQIHDIEEVVEHDGEDQIYEQQYNDENQYDPRRASNRVLPPPIQVPTQTSPHIRPFSTNSQYLPYYFSPLQNNTLSHQTSEMIMLNERHNYMKSLATDATQVKLIVCGSSQFNDNIRKCLVEKLGFPIDDKAIFIN
ncbi:17006_t:CDS:2 [Funneliformis geosporum]|uniref:17006_t:CDS:1 n=1 Tax=Funneliformis geosporum TaxID=1117311 RepID=A0A9W4WRG8_9GLOM|nr:17006_t:CDS:2 [Funneliformis geosporum]